MGLIRYLGVAPAYRGRGLATEMFAAAEREAVAHEKGSEDMPFRINVDKDNLTARAIYEHWGFEYWRMFTSKTGREYAHLWRPPTEHGPEATASWSGRG
jgi:ribosomal protein S18 acetylase RimI-like enzyme